MWNEPTQQELSSMPKLYDTEEIPLKDKIIHLHLFIGGSDWYLIEYDGTDIFFGYAILNSDFQMAEFGYVSFSELKNLKVSGVFEVDRDLHWKPTEARHIDKICKGMGWSPSKKHIEHMLETSGVLSDACKHCGAIVDTAPSEKALFCKECGATTIKEQFYIGKKMYSQKPTA